MGENEGDPLIGLAPNLYSRTISIILRLINDKIRKNKDFRPMKNFFATLYISTGVLLFLNFDKNPMTSVICIHSIKRESV